MAIEITAEKHPTEQYARLVFKAGSELDLHALDLIYQALCTKHAKEARFESSDTVMFYFQTVEDFPQT